MVLSSEYKPEDFIRLNGGRIEIFITGLSVCYSSLIRQDSGTYKDKSSDRVMWICQTIRDNLSALDLSKGNVILDSRMENFFINYITKNVIKELGLTNVRVLTSVDPKDVLNGIDYTVDLLAYTDYCGFHSDLINESIDWKNIEVDIPIMSLAGRPSISRARFTRDILDICGNNLRVSLGNTIHYTPSAELERQFKDILYPHSYPVNINSDNKILGNITSLQKNTGKNLYKSLVSIVNETNDFSVDHIHLSEKSFKFFAWHQIPIFNSSPKQVETIRNLGFDLFDDIIDHSYDTAPNEHLHRLKLLNTISKFLTDYPTIEDVNRLRKDIFHRLADNNKLLINLNKRKIIDPWPKFN